MNDEEECSNDDGIRVDDGVGQSTQVQQNSKPYSDNDMDISLDDEEDDDDNDDEEEIILQGRVRLSHRRNDRNEYSSNEDSEDTMFASLQRFIDERDADANANADVDKEYQGEYKSAISDINHSNNSNNEEGGNGTRLPRDAKVSSSMSVKDHHTTSYSTNINTQSMEYKNSALRS